MYKRLLSSLLCVVISFFLLPTVVSADVGPKSSVSVEFDGIKDEVYYITLLSKTESTGPHSYSTQPIDQNSYMIDEDHRVEDISAWLAFRDYSDADGFYFLDYFSRNEENTFEWGYFPPSIFKVLIYFPQDNKFVATEILEEYAFHSYYKVTLSKDYTVLNIEKTYEYLAEILHMMLRILLTLAVEILIALWFGLRKKNILILIIVVNTITQIILNIVLNFINHKNGGIAFVFYYILIELLIILIEAIVFSIGFKKCKSDPPIKKWVAPVYSLVANSASFAVGILVSFYIPGIF